MMSKKTVKESMFTTWMEANKIYPHDRKLTYPQYVSSFVYVARNRCWKPRKQGYTIGHLIWIPPSTGELFFVRMILFVAKGPTSYDEIRKIDGQLIDEEVQHRCLCRIEDLLQGNGKSLSSFSAMPYPIDYAPEHVDEKNDIFHKIMNVVEAQYGGVFFLYGYGGTGKTFMWKTLASTIRSIGDIMLTVASSGIASLLLPGRRTAHSKFVIPVLAIANTNSNHLPFGGKLVVFGGDFCQILPVVPKGNRSNIDHAAINSSYLWNHCQVLRRWYTCEPNDGYVEITIPDEFLINDYNNPLEEIVNRTYPNLLQFYNNPEYLQSRSILASTIEVVDKKEYYSADSINKSDALQNLTSETVTPEFLNSLNTSKDGKIISTKNIGHKTYIPRMNMSPSESPWHFKLIRRQFPFMVSFAMSINKSQGQSLLDVIYVALSRVQSKQGLRILILDQQGKPCNTTINMGYKDVFQNL
ncbi:hypothetical protein D0Y65_041441 [Glycine soja]|uniref:ATP-dependent DNA helicase n=2 Tax=Glycine subgen. Soja TaxID=1462606 RepID=A0A0R0GEH3_SOYBN|nr:hypothetical protein D0Y65_041441 [Glycine soja]